MTDRPDPLREALILTFRERFPHGGGMIHASIEHVADCAVDALRAVPEAGSRGLDALEHDVRSVMATAEEARDRVGDDDRLYYVGMVYAYLHVIDRIGWLRAAPPAAPETREPQWHEDGCTLAPADHDGLCVREPAP